MFSNLAETLVKLRAYLNTFKDWVLPKSDDQTQDWGVFLLGV